MKPDSPNHDNQQPTVRQPFQADPTSSNPTSSNPNPSWRVSYERHLPHRVPKGYLIFLTWNLKGSLPAKVFKELEQLRETLERQTPRPGETTQQRRIRHDKIIFDRCDQYLDSTRDGPMWLQDPAAADEVVASLLWGIPERYELYAWVVMGNHVHVLLKPLVPLEAITQGIKGYTGWKINRIQNQPGRIFWQDESYDHWARDEDEMYRIIFYIENNPVRAKLCREPHEWPWSSARWRGPLQWQPGKPFGEQWKHVTQGTSGFPA
jgi:putative transposase